MFTRKIGKILLGKATPFHLIATCLFAGWVAFAPGFGQAPALWAVLIALICILPVNLGLLSLIGLVLYPLSLLLAPATFEVGRVLLDGPTQPLFVALINAPFFALMGFEYYVGAGGLVMGALFGGLVGIGMTRLVKSIRERVKTASSDSARYQVWSAKWYVKLSTWVLFGTNPKAATYEALEGKRVGKPVRPVGIVIGVVVIGAFLGLGQLLSGPYLTRALQAGLERTNGATVDLAEATISLEEGRLVIDGLAMADPKNLATDLLKAVRVEADIGGAELLARRIRVDKLVVTDSASGAQRETPGVLTGTEPVPQDGSGAGGDTTGEEEEVKTIDDYLEDGRMWRERLAQAQSWLERLSGPSGEEGDGSGEGLAESLERRVRELGYANVTADHLIRGTPLVVIGELRMENMQALQLGGKSVSVIGTNLSTQPFLMNEAPHLIVRAADGSLLFDLNLAGASKGGGTNAIDFAFKGIDGDSIGRQLKTSALSGGTIDLASKGTWTAGGGIEMPFQVTLIGTTLSLGGRSETIDRLELPLRVSGSLDDPRVLFRDEDLKQALIGAGKKELANRASAEIDKHVPDDIKKKLGDTGGLFDKLKPK